MSKFILTNVFKGITSSVNVIANNPIIDLDDTSVDNALTLCETTHKEIPKSWSKAKKITQQAINEKSENALVCHLATLTFNQANASALNKSLSVNVKESYTELMNSPNCKELFVKLVDALWLLDRQNILQVNESNKAKLLDLAKAKLSEDDFEYFKALKSFVGSDPSKSKQFKAYQTVTRYVAMIQKDIYSENGGAGFVMGWNDKTSKAKTNPKKFEKAEKVCLMAKLAKQLSNPDTTDINLLISIMAETPEFLATAKAIQKQLDVIIPNAEKVASVKAQKVKDQLQETKTKTDKNELEDPELKNNITAQLKLWDSSLVKAKMCSKKALKDGNSKARYDWLMTTRAKSETTPKDCQTIDQLTAQYQEITKGLPTSIQAH